MFDGVFNSKWSGVFFSNIMDYLFIPLHVRSALNPS